MSLNKTFRHFLYYWQSLRRDLYSLFKYYLVSILEVRELRVSIFFTYHPCPLILLFFERIFIIIRPFGDKDPFGYWFEGIYLNFHSLVFPETEDFKTTNRIWATHLSQITLC